MAGRRAAELEKELGIEIDKVNNSPLVLLA